tara:strand:+ start:1213 stop:1554 length:342 start_codon:yes stop_codon:yes gene_type:complete
MSDSSSVQVNGGQLQDFTIDQFAGALALTLGSVGGLLMIIWKSRCSCRVRLGLSDKCYLFDCERAPPPDDKDSDEEDPKVKGKGKVGKKDKTPQKKSQVVEVVTEEPEVESLM